MSVANRPGTSTNSSNVRYEPNELPPNSLSAGLGFQFVMLTVAGIVLTPAIVVRAAGAAEIYLSWAVFAALLICGITTVLQAVRVGRVGAGYILLMGTSGAFIAVCVTALAQGGPGMLATLVLISSLFQFTLSSRLALLRRIITPAVTGTVIMLISVTVMPILFDMLGDVPPGTSSAAAPASVLTTLFVTIAIVLRGSGAWRLWAPVLGIVTGCVVAGFFGIYDTSRVASAGWIGFPEGTWPGFTLDFGPNFWALLPAFIFVTLVGAIETIGDSVAIQKVSWRRPRATDYRAVQGAVAADGVGNLLSGLAGTVPNTTYSSSVAVTEITGVAAKRVGVWIGVIFAALAFLPKITALLLAVPNPVVGAYGLVLISILFVLGMKIAVQDGADYRKATVVGVAFWVGTGFQTGVIFPELLGEWLGGLLGNGMTAGGLTALVLTAFMEMTARRRKRIVTELSTEALPTLKNFFDKTSGRYGWGPEMIERLHNVVEETMLTLKDHAIVGEGDSSKARRLLVLVGADGDAAELEFVATSGEGNIEDRLALLDSQPEASSPDHELSLRLLRHFASSVRHQQYSDTDILTVRVEVPGQSEEAAED